MSKGSQQSLLEGPVYASLERFADALLLSVVWVVASLPVVTFFPATAAMFGVLRDRDQGRETPLVRTFARHLRANLRQALVLQGIVAATWIAVAVNAEIATRLDLVTGTVLRLASVGALALVVVVSLYALPMMVGYEMTVPEILAASTLIALGSWRATVRCCLSVGFGAALTFLFPPAPLLAGALIAESVYRVCDASFRAHLAQAAEPHREVVGVP